MYHGVGDQLADGQIQLINQGITPPIVQCCLHKTACHPSCLGVNNKLDMARSQLCSRIHFDKYPQENPGLVPGGKESETDWRQSVAQSGSRFGNTVSL